MNRIVTSRGNGVPFTRRSLLFGGTASVLMGCSSARPEQSRNDGSHDPAGLYDQSMVHAISVEYAASDYEALIAAYRADSEKVWVHATVVIDGTKYRNAGLRLKGNSSLFGLGGRNGPGGLAGPDAGGNAIAGPVIMLGPNGASKDTPERLPWLIRLDKYVRGQNHRGETRVVIRSSNTTTGLNEAVALDMLGAAGLATERCVPVRFRAAGSDESMRLAVELPTAAWAKRTLGPGPLYKAKSGGDYSYRGASASDYVGAFEQEAGVDDFGPLAKFLQFINDSSDAEFVTQLADHLEVDSFAAYLATQDLLGNFDDIDGPGNNSYLYANPDTRRMTVVAWDHNLALTDGPGGFVNIVNTGVEPGVVVPDGLAGEAVMEGGRLGIGPSGAGNILAKRFNEHEVFTAKVAAAKTRLTAALITSGAAIGFLAERAAVIASDASDLVTTDQLTSEVESISSRLKPPS
jgi:spore coat protein CotH